MKYLGSRPYSHVQRLFPCPLGGEDWARKRLFYIGDTSVSIPDPGVELANECCSAGIWQRIVIRWPHFPPFPGIVILIQQRVSVAWLRPKVALTITIGCSSRCFLACLRRLPWTLLAAGGQILYHLMAT